MQMTTAAKKDQSYLYKQNFSITNPFICLLWQQLRVTRRADPCCHFAGSCWSHEVGDLRHITCH